MLRPRVKRVHRPLVRPDGTIRLGLEQFGIASEIVDDEYGTVARLLELMDGTLDGAGISARLSSTHPDWTAGDVESAIDELVRAGHVEDAAAPLPPGLSESESDRYRSTRDFLAWIDASPRSSPYEALARIRKAEVALLGLGGTGSSVAAGLVASGVGALRCADFDVVEEGNLTRQLLYCEADVGRPKAAAAAERLTALNSTVAVTAQDLRVSSVRDVERFIAGCDAFVLCADEPAGEIQSWANEAALRTSTPWFTAAYTGAMTGVGQFVPGETGCWECLDRQQPAADGRWLFDDLPHAVIAASAGIAGHLCGLAVLYQLAGLPTQIRGGVFQLNLARWDHSYFLAATRDPHCPACGDRTS